MKASNKEILKLAIPNIISNLSQPLLSSVDTALMGGISIDHLGAVGLSAMIFNVLFWNFGFLRMGSTGMTAQAYGQQDKEKMINVLFRATAVAFIIAIILIVLSPWLLTAGTFLLNINVEQQGIASSYFKIRILAAPATLFLYAATGWFLGMQNAKIPLIITLFINGINIVMSYLLVHQFDYGIEGVAIGTVVAQYSGMLLAMILITVFYRPFLVLSNSKKTFNRTQLLRFFKVNRDILLRTVCLTFSFAFFYRESSSLGTVALAGNVILLQFIGWMAFFVDGFAFAAESLVGKYLGARSFDVLRSNVKNIFGWSLVIASFFSFLYYFYAGDIALLFSQDKKVLDYLLHQKLWIVFLPLIATPSYVFDGVFIGLTEVRYMRNSIFLSLIIYVFSYTLMITYGCQPIISLWISFLLFMLSRSVIQGYQYLFQVSFKDIP